MTVFGLTRPTDEHIRSTLDRCRAQPFSYPHVGASKTHVPNGWRTDDQRIHIGSTKDFQAAKRALTRWVQFDLDWVFPYRNDVPIEVGNLFCFLSYQFGLWALNVSRIVYLIDEYTKIHRRYGFAYGTVGSHSVSGEEAFTIELDKRTNQLFFRLAKFSKPAHLFTKIAPPLTSRAQDRFTRDALERFKQEVTV